MVLSFQNPVDTLHPSHTSLTFQTQQVTHYYSIPLYKLLPLLPCFAFSPVHCKLLLRLQGQTHILFFSPSIPTHPKGSPQIFPLNPIATYLYILIPQPQHMKHEHTYDHCILSDLIIKSWFVLQESTRKSHFCEIFIYF